MIASVMTAIGVGVYLAFGMYNGSKPQREIEIPLVVILPKNPSHTNVMSR